MSEGEKSFREALLSLPFWAKIVLCLADFVYGIERSIEAYRAKNVLALVVSIVWIFVYPANLIVDLVYLLLKGRWLSILELFAEAGNVDTHGAIEVEVKEKDGN